jgi:hypothetical protein
VDCSHIIITWLSVIMRLVALFGIVLILTLTRMKEFEILKLFKNFFILTSSYLLSFKMSYKLHQMAQKLYKTVLYCSEIVTFPMQSVQNYTDYVNSGFVEETIKVTKERNELH